jgi:hypothetical protein
MTRDRSFLSRDLKTSGKGRVPDGALISIEGNTSVCPMTPGWSEEMVGKKRPVELSRSPTSGSFSVF